MFRSSHDIRLPREYDARLTSRLVSSHIFLRFRCSFSGMDAQFALGQDAPSICINLGAKGPKAGQNCAPKFHHSFNRGHYITDLNRALL